MLPKSGGDFNATGANVIAPGLAANRATRTVLASRVIPAGAKALLETWSARVIDQSNDNQIFFAIERNGAALQSGLERIPGTQFTYQPQLTLNVLVAPGTIEIVAYNISGVPITIEPQSIAAPVDITCEAWWSGSLTSERGGFS